jgi:hypothetical protein
MLFPLLVNDLRRKPVSPMPYKFEKYPIPCGCVKGQAQHIVVFQKNRIVSALNTEERLNPKKLIGKWL